jgi:predicted DCC family thiol-disulfide oxidoreductase YuxK
MTGGAPLLLYDGVCALCNGAVTFVLKRDRRRVVRFAALQGATAATVRAKHPGLGGTDSMIWIDADGRMAIRSNAAIAIGTYLGGFWGVVAAMTRLIPPPIRDWVYDLVARVRYRFFGKYDACPIPPAEHRGRFLD